MSALVPQSTARWELIQVPQDNLSPRAVPAVTPINDNEIVIMGGWDGDKRISDVVIFDTTTYACQKVTDGGDYKFAASANQCRQAD